MKCKTCGRELCSSDHGYYCSNQECSEYDKEMLAYEQGEAITAPNV